MAAKAPSTYTSPSGAGEFRNLQAICQGERIDGHVPLIDEEVAAARPTMGIHALISERDTLGDAAGHPNYGRIRAGLCVPSAAMECPR